MQNVISQHIEYPSFIIPAMEEKIKFCPSLSARNQEQRKLLPDFRLYTEWKACLPTRDINEKQNNHRQVVADFLQRIPKQGWASKAKPIPNLRERLPPTRDINEKQNKHRRWLLISCKGVPTRDGRAKRSQSLPQ